MATVAREAMSDEQFTRLLQFFQVFSNESRLRLIGHLANGERSVGELAKLLDLREPTVSHHLAELKELGLVDVRAEGNMRIYQLNAKALESISKDIFARPNLAALVPKSELNEEERLLRAWVKNGRICLLYTSDAADERSSVDLGGPRIIKKKKNIAGTR